MIWKFWMVKNSLRFGVIKEGTNHMNTKGGSDLRETE